MDANPLNLRSNARLSVLLVLLVCGLPGVVTAQERSGFWIEFDLGRGSSARSAGGTVGSVFNGDSWVCASGLALGWSVHPQLRAGIEFRGPAWTWWAGDWEGRLSATNVSGILTYYPRAASGFHVKGGVGGLFLDMDVDGFEGPAGNSSRGFGFTTGTGYDVYLGRRFWLTPAVNYSYGRSGDVQFNGDAVVRDWKQQQFDFTLGIKFD